MRIARRLGKINNEVQTRVMRRLAPRESQLHWEAMMRLRAQIEKDIAPIMAARRAAEYDCFQIKFKVDAKDRATPVKVIPAPRKRQKLTGYEYTRAWWDEMELKERADRKREKAEVAA